MNNEESTPLLFPTFRIQRSTAPFRSRERACWPIIVAESLERLAWFSISVNLIVVLTNPPLCWQSGDAASLQLFITCISYGISLLGGWVADSYIGHFSTVITGYVVYLSGYTLLLVGTFYLPSADAASGEILPCNGTAQTFAQRVHHLPQVSIYVALALIALGAGVVRINLALLGGDQIGENGSAATRLFFTRYFWGTNFSALCANVAISIIQQQISSLFGYELALISLICSMLVFSAGTGMYRMRMAEAGDVVTNLFKIVANAYKVKKSNPRLELDQFLDYANMYNEGGNFNSDQIDDVRKLVKVVKVFVLTVPYWICYSQMIGSLFLLQGLRLRTVSSSATYPWSNTCQSTSDLSTHNICSQIKHYNSTDIDSYKMAVPGSALTMFNPIFILLLLPFTQKFYSWLAAHKIKVYTWRRMLAGMLLAVLSLLVAGGVETMRLSDLCHSGLYLQKIDGTVYQASPNMSIWWQTPQYGLVGASEIFVVLTGMEFAYMEAPRNMQGIAMGIYWCAAGLGHVIGIAVPGLFNLFGTWNQDADINCNRLDYIFYILAVFLLACSVVFSGVANRYDLSLSKVITERRSNDDLEQLSGFYSRSNSNSNIRRSVASGAAVF